jgi:hypothetical protein
MLVTAISHFVWRGCSMSEDARPSWWNPWHWPVGIWVLVIAFGLMLIPFGIRAIRLSGVPAMDEPFDVEEFVKCDVPEAENAFTDYRQAADLRAKYVADLVARSAKEPETFGVVFEQGWTAADDATKEWLEANRESLDVWRRGTEKQHALYISPVEFNIETMLPVVQEMRAFVRLAMLEHARLLHERNLDEAWQWSRAAFRSGGHTSHRGCIIQGLVGIAIHAMSTNGMAQWAEQPGVSEEQLKQAIAQIKSDFALYEKESNIFKAEYLMTRNTLLSSSWFQMVSSGSMGSGNSPVPASIVKMGLWVVGEAELTLRLIRPIYANQLPELDKPVSQRRKPAGSGMIMLFDQDPAVALAPRQLDVASIERRFAGSWVARLLAPASKQADNAMLRLRCRQAAAEAMLAAQAYHRSHGEFPMSLAELVPNFLDAVPLDPCDPSGAMLLYRRDEASKAVVWSVGEDGTDSGGNVSFANNNRASDVGFELKLAQ